MLNFVPFQPAAKKTKNIIVSSDEADVEDEYDSDGDSDFNM